MDRQGSYLHNGTDPLFWQDRQARSNTATSGKRLDEFTAAGKQCGTWFS